MQSFVCPGNTLSDGKLPVDDINGDSQHCRPYVRLTVCKQESCVADGACISLSTVDDRQLSLAPKLSYNSSHVTDHPQSTSRISWIDLEQPTSRRDVDVPEDKTWYDEVTEAKSLDVGRHVSLDERERREAEYRTSNEAESEMDSLKLLTTLSREEDNTAMRDNRTLRSEVDRDSDVDSLLICDEHSAKLVDIVDSGCDGDWLSEDDDTQLKLQQDAEHSTSQLSTRQSSVSVTSVQCTS